MYKSIGLYDFLNTEAKNWAKILFKALFAKDMPEDKFKVALNLLAVCLPINHIYVGKKVINPLPLLRDFKQNYGSSLQDALETYEDAFQVFSCGNC